jgi:hypothetical protein
VNVLLFLLLPALIVGGYALYQWAQTRQPSSLESGVDAFRREMQALSPEARPPTRRPGAGRYDDLEPEHETGTDRAVRPPAGPGPSHPGPSTPGDRGEPGPPGARRRPPTPGGS